MNIVAFVNFAALILQGKAFRYSRFFWTILTLIVIAASSIIPASARADALPAPITDEAALLKADSDFCQLCLAKGMQESFLAYAAEDATMLVQGGPPVHGKEAIRKLLEDTEEVVLTWHPLKAEAARSGELGYTYGLSEMRIKSPDGSERVRHGQYSSIWKKQADGSWKFIVDIGNFDTPPPAAVPAPLPASPSPSPKNS